MAGRWHEQEGVERAREVENIADGLWADQALRRTRYLRNVQLFEVIDIPTADAAGYCRALGGANLAIPSDRLGLIRSGVQTAAAEVFAKQKPKPQFQTSGADWRTRRKAKKLDKLCEGILHQRQGKFLDVWDFVFDAGVELLVQGTAAMHVLASSEAGKIEHELVPIKELYFDPNEGRDPQNLFRVSPIDQDKAIARFASGDSAEDLAKREAIESAAQFEGWDQTIASSTQPRAAKRIRMVQAWRLPFGKDKPGAACVIINGQVMAEEEWTAPAFPFVFAHWEPHRLSPWASGLVEEGAELAEKAGDLDERMLNRARVCGGRRIYVHEEAVVNEASLEENDAEVVIKLAPNAPVPQETLVPPFTDAEMQYVRARVQAYWDAIGVSQISAAARREPGVESAVAMRTLNDTKAGRQLPRAKMYEKIFVDLAQQYIYRLREMAANDSNFAVRWAGKSVLQEIKWSEADPGDDANFSVTVAPASALPSDPAGRLSMAGELYASKLIDATTYKQLLGWPDLEQELNSESAEYEYIDFLLDKYLDAEKGSWGAGDYESPEGAIVDKPRALMRFTSALFQAKREKAPEFNLKLLRRYIKELGQQISAAQQAQAAASAPPPGTQAAPPAGPMPAQAVAA